MIQIIAEIAQGYEGNYQQAAMLIRAGKFAGADAVKMQLVYADELCTSDYKDFKLFSQLEMCDEHWQKLSNIAKDIDIEFHLDIFGEKSLLLCERINANAVKIHSTDMGNIGLLELVEKSSIKKVFLSAGGAYLNEIIKAVDVLKSKEIILLLGFQGYPTQVNENQISRVYLLRKYFIDNSSISIGFADHANPQTIQSLLIPSMAIGAGARFIEKHLTLSSVLKLEDYESALNPDQFLVFTKELKCCYEAFGSTVENQDFGMTDSEINYRNWTRKHVVASRKITSDSIIYPEDLKLKRTPNKNAISDINNIYGKKAIRDIEPDEPILATMIEMKDDNA